MISKHTRIKFACYSANVTMLVESNLSPVLFLTFNSLYGISYSLLGLLVLVNFVTNLVGIITDSVIARPRASALAETLSLTAEELGMKVGMLSGMIFSMIAIFVYLYIWKKSKKIKRQ